MSTLDPRGGAPPLLTAEDVIRILGLAPLPREGGFFRETYRSGLSLPGEALGGAFAGPRCAGTAIYYLLTRETFSAFHKLKGDEVFHHYAGDPVELLRIDGEGRLDRAVLGPDLANGERPQAVVSAGAWQASRLARDAPTRPAGAGAHGACASGAPGAAARGPVGWALLGTTMAPGFEFADYEHGGRADLMRRFPAHAALVEELATDP